MKAQYDAIGETAGRIYTILESKGKKTLTTLQKEAAVDSALFNQAVGWLAREGNLSFEKKGKSWQLGLS